MKSSRHQFLDAVEEESKRTLRVLRAYPDDQSGYKPHERSRSAREVAWPMALGLERLILKALTTGLDFSPSSMPPSPPERISEITAAVEESFGKIAARLRDIDDSRLEGTVKFFVAPKTMGDIPMTDFLWSILFDHVHHRGQLSVYLRIVGKVPSIYGPSGDQPWR